MSSNSSSNLCRKVIIFSLRVFIIIINKSIRNQIIIMLKSLSKFTWTILGTPLIKTTANNFSFGPFKVQYWDLATEKAKHHLHNYNPDPLRFALKRPGKITSKNQKRQNRLIKFKKYKLKTRQAAMNRVIITGPKWNRTFLIK